MAHTFKRIPTFTRELHNSAPSPLAELEIKANQAAGVSDFLLEVEARFQELTVQPSDWSREVQLRVNIAYLHLHVEGCAVSMTQYVGRDAIPQSHDWHYEVSDGTNSSIVEKDATENFGGFELTPLTPKALGGVKETFGKEKTRGSTRATKVSYKTTEYLFKRLANNHWRIKDPRHQPLEGPAAPEDYFCKIEYEADAGEIVGFLKSHPKDIVVEYAHDGQWNHNLLKFSPKHRAIINCLVGQHLRSVNPLGGGYADGRIHLARCTLTYRETVEPDSED